MKQSQDKLGTMPIGRLLLTMSVPMMISMFVQALYNMVDSMFVAKLSEDALTAVSLAFPVQNIMNAIAVGTGVGVNALVSRSLGQGNRERAEKAANVQMFLSACYTVASAAVGLFLVRSFYTGQTDVESIVEYGCDYLSIVCVVSIGAFYGQNLEKLLTATGNSGLSMVSQAAGAVINIILDPLLIFGPGPFPALGVKGAAIATVIGQIAAALLALFFNIRKNQATRFRFSKMLPESGIIADIFAVGFPSMITIGLGSAMNYCVNRILLGFSTTATAVFGIWQKMQSFGFMPVFGLNNGTVAIYSYNHGAKKYDRVKQTFALALKVGIGVTAAVTVLYELIPAKMLELFSASDYMMSIGVKALRICALSLPFGACSIVLSSSFQSLRRSRYTLIINILRQFAIQVAAMWLLSLSGVLDAVWFAPLIAEAASALVAIFLARKVMAGLDEQAAADKAEQ